MSQRQLTKAQLLDAFCESHKQIERYVAEGMPCTGTGRSRRFPWPEVRNWRDERIRKQEREKAQREQPTNIEDARLRKEVALAEKAEIEVSQLRAEMIPAGMYEQRIEALAVRLAAPVKTLDRYIADVQRATTAVEAKAVLDRISDDLLRALAGVADDLDEPNEQDDDSASDAAA